MVQVVFVFGSNDLGRHGKGAARDAYEKWGAEMGVGEGPTGRAYAIPTKDRDMRTKPLGDIEAALRRFREYAWNRRGTVFLLTPVGCGLAGHAIADITRIVRKLGMPPNVVLTPSWLDHLAPDDREKAA